MPTPQNSKNSHKRIHVLEYCFILCLAYFNKHCVQNVKRCSSRNFLIHHDVIFTEVVALLQSVWHTPWTTTRDQVKLRQARSCLLCTAVDILEYRNAISSCASGACMYDVVPQPKLSCWLSERQVAPQRQYRYCEIHVVKRQIRCKTSSKNSSESMTYTCWHC